MMTSMIVMIMIFFVASSIAEQSVLPSEEDNDDHDHDEHDHYDYNDDHDDQDDTDDHDVLCSFVNR